MGRQLGPFFKWVVALKRGTMEEIEGIMRYLVICCICLREVDEVDEVETRAGPAHESCAEKIWPLKSDG